MTQKIFTNCFLVKRDTEGKIVEVCLAMKKRGWGEGLWNGSGGKLLEGETAEMAAVREVEEELGVKISKIIKRAEINWYLKEEDKNVFCHVYFGEEWDGEPTESEEMNPKWFAIKEIPFDKMWESDREWLTQVLNGKTIKAKYTYIKEGGSLESKNISEVKVVEEF